MKFFPSILPDLTPGEHYFSLGLSKDRRQQRAHETRDGIIEHAAALCDRGYDAYFALAGFGDPSKGRTKLNARKVKSFWADIDVGKASAPYKTQPEAATALATFAADTGLKPTWIVSSGKGLHVYWALTRTINTDMWRGVAPYFKIYMQQHGLSADPARTADITSVLRVPGTKHQKSGATVQILGCTGVVWDPGDFATHVGRPGTPRTPLPTEAQDGVFIADPALMAQMGMGPSPLKPKAEPIIRHCRQIMTMGGGQYPQWFAAMSVLKRCEDGEMWVHKLSALDPRYDAATTALRFGQAAADAPCTCATFASYEPKWCEGCAFRGVVRSPVQLHTVDASPIPAPEVVTAPDSTPLPELPEKPDVPEEKVGPKPEVKPKPQPEEDDVEDLEEREPVELFDPDEDPIRDLPTPEIDPNPTPLHIDRRLTYPDIVEKSRVPIKHPRYKVDSRGVVAITMEDAGDGTLTAKEEVATQSQIYYKYSVKDMAEEFRADRRHIFEIVHPSGKVEQAVFDITKDMSLMTIMKWVCNNNIFPVSATYGAKFFMSFMNAYLASVVHTSTELETVKKFGWVSDTSTNALYNLRGFVIGKGMITDSGVTPMAYGGEAKKISTHELTTKGTLEGWKYVAEMYKHLRQPVGQLAVCLSFAAPLMRWGFGEATSATFSLWSPKSGMGKSQVLRAAASVWGDPKQAFIERTSSVVARTRKMSVLQNLPVFLDELTSLKPEDMYGLAYTLVSGKEKTKLKSGGESFVDTGEWATITLTSANTSFKAAVGAHTGDSDASVIRVMEYEANFPDYSSNPEVQQYINRCMALCRENYGLAGPEFIYQIMRRPERLASLTQYVENWHEKYCFLAKERFLSAPLALAIIAGRWAVEFGLLDYDMQALEKWIINDFVPRNRADNLENAPKLGEAFYNFLAEQTPSTVIVAYPIRPGHMPSSGNRFAPDKYAPVIPNGQITARLELSPPKLYVAKDSFISWCKKRGIATNNVLRWLKERMLGVEERRKNLAAGIPYVTSPAVKCLVLNEDQLMALGYNCPTRKQLHKVRQFGVDQDTGGDG